MATIKVFSFTACIDGSIHAALEETYQRKLRHSSTRSTDIVDVYCGQEYQRHSFLRDENNISFTVNTDGVNIFRSSKYSLWPVWLVINELPPAER